MLAAFDTPVADHDRHVATGGVQLSLLVMACERGVSENRATLVADQGRISPPVPRLGRWY